QRKMPHSNDSQAMLRYLSVMLRQARVLSHVVDQILDTAMVQNDQLILHPEPVAPVELLRDVVAEQQELYTERSIQLEIERAPRQRADWDRQRVRQILLHLIKNALIYSPQDTPVEVSLSYTPSSVYIQVRDHGRGISTAQQNNIFSRFWRGVDNSVKKDIY